MTDAQTFFAIQQVIVSLFGAIDLDNADCVASHFSSDGRWHRKEGIRQGSGQIVQEMRDRPKNRVIEHVITNLLVVRQEVEMVEVSFKSLAFAAEVSSGNPLPMSHPLGLDSYRAILVRIEGEWLVKDLVGTRIFQRL